MKKSEMIEAIASTTGLSKSDVEKVFTATFDLFRDELVNGNKVSVAGFGVFKISERAAREGRNPQTGATIQIAASKSVGFKAGTALKDAVNKAFEISEPGDIILLSPSTSSFDEFKGYEERGRIFKQYVNEK